jgi:dipeptidyl aminopeptidase/acylaminoacyl peptidase
MPVTSYRFEQFLNARSAYGATFDAAGDRLYFVSDLSGTPQLWSVLAGATESWPEPVAVNLDRVMLAAPSPKPGRLVLGADIGGNERMQLYLIDGLGVAPRLLTSEPTAIHTFGGWHPDGKQIVFSSNERDPRFFDVFTLDVETGARRLLFQGDNTYYAGAYSPDGRSVLVQRADVGSDQAIYVLEVESGALRPMTDTGAPSKYGHLSWSKDGGSLYCQTDRDREHLYIAKLDAETGALEPVVTAEWDIGDYALSRDGRRLAYEVNADGFSEIRVLDQSDGRNIVVDLPRGVAADPSRWYHSFGWDTYGDQFAVTVTTATATADVYLAHLGGGPPTGAKVRRVTHAWKAGLDEQQLVPAELAHFPTFDGRQIPTFVFRPKDDPDGPTGPRATIFLVHGGPESQLRPSFNPTIQYLVQRGFVVVAPNVRGSSGYGKTYMHLDDVELRMDSVADLAAGAKWAADSGLSDRNRIAVMGQSYGGFMVLAAVTEYPELWAAGIDIYGIANFVTFMENTGPWRRKHRGAEYGTLERHRDVLERISPIHKADQIQAPMLMVHGANDPRVPIGETEQILENLRSRGRPAEYVRFEDEGHGIVKLKNKLVAWPKIGDFLEEHLGAS